jgi:AAA domain/DnaB-like helicase N terminal domain
MSSTSPIRSRNFPTDKPLPQNPDAERSLLGAILLENRTLKDAAEVITAADFCGKSPLDLSTNGRIFFAMLNLDKEKKPVDLLTVTDRLNADAELSAYISSLVDGVPRGSNVKHCATMIREKAMRRALIYKGDELQRRAWEGGDSVESIVSELDLFLRSATITVARAGHKPVDLSELCAMDLPARTFVLEPILPVKSIAMVYSWRGGGKTYFMLYLSYAISVGKLKVFNWKIPEARPVLYVDGEMDSTELQERAQKIVIGNASHVPDPGMMRFITPDLEEHTPEILTADGRRRIEDQLRGGELLVLDNLSSLVPSGEERETEEWAIVQEWLLKLRRCGYTTVFCHHAGKGGGQRGTSNREDLLNLVINLRRPPDYSPEDGLRAEVHCEKARGQVGLAVQPFEVRLDEDDRRHLVWTTKPLKEQLERRAAGMFTAGDKNREVSEVLNLTRWQVHRLRKRFEKGELPPPDEL